MDGVEDVAVGQSIFAQGGEVPRAYGRGSASNNDREPRQGFLPRSQSGAPVVALDPLGQLRIACFCTEILPVRLDSIETVVGPGNDRGEQLALGA